MFNSLSTLAGRLQVCRGAAVRTKVLLLSESTPATPTGAATFLKAVFRGLLVLPWSGFAFLRGETLDLFDPAMAALHVAYLGGGIVFGAATMCSLVGVAGRQVVVWLGRSVDAALIDLLSGMFVSSVQSR
jgi:hypothetical protein